MKPKIVCLCGSTRFGSTFAEANLQETLKGNIVLTIGCNMKDDDTFAHMSDADKMEIKAKLDILHLAKIDLAHEVLFLDVNGYMGESTRRELQYSVMRDKRIRYWSEEKHI